MEMEGLLVEVKRKDEDICARESVLEQAQTEGELINTSLKRAKQDLARKVLQCKTLEVKMGQISPSTPNGVSDDGSSPGEGVELEGLKSQHRESMEAVQSLWKETETKKAEYESHVARLGPQEEMMNQMRGEFSAQRNWLVTRLEEMYDLHTGREKPVSQSVSNKVVGYYCLLYRLRLRRNWWKKKKKKVLKRMKILLKSWRRLNSRQHQSKNL